MKSYIEYCCIDGRAAHDDRINTIDEYNKPGSEKYIFLLTTCAGGLGINLTAADIVVPYDSDRYAPHPSLHSSAMLKQVYISRFITENRVEERMLERVVQLRLDRLVIQQGRCVQPFALVCMRF